jgi:branched-chain amino acid transport system permease protein
MNSRNWLLTFAVGLLVLSAFPAFVDSYMLTVFRDALIFGLFAASLDFFWGRTGILCFGHACFFGLGGYAMAIVSMTMGLPAAPLLGILAAVALAAGVAAVVGYFLFFGGVRGSYFTIVTLALSVIAQQVAVSWSSVTGGDTGLLGVPPLAIGGLDLSGDLASYITVASILVVVLLGLWLLSRGSWGKVLTAISDNETRAAALGYNAAARLTATFVLSAAIAGLAGALYVAMAGLVAPDLIGLLLSTEVVVWVAIGGRGTLIGPVVGAVLVQRAQQEISSFNPSLWPLVIGCIFVLIVFLLPDGVLSITRRIGDLARRRQS